MVAKPAEIVPPHRWEAASSSNVVALLAPPAKAAGGQITACGHWVTWEVMDQG